MSTENIGNSSLFDGKNINNLAYLKLFGWESDNPEKSKKYESTSRLAKAYEVALDIRKFEIELYWKRSTNFWLLIAGISTGLGVLAAGSPAASGASSLLTLSSKEMACLILSLAGSMLCAGWWLVNNASKFWQTNWERQVDILEQELVGPLYKTVLSKEGTFTSKSYFSVSDINKFSSAYLFCLYVFVSLYFLGLFNIFDNSQNYEFNIWKTVVFAANLCFACIFYLRVKVKTDKHKNSNKLDIEVEASIRKVDLIKSYSSNNGGGNSI